MRLFFAIALGEPLRAAAARVADTLQERLAAAGNARAVKWVERENLHITMRFLGEVDETRAGTLLKTFSQRLPAPSFDLVVGGAGAFPSAGPPRVLWVGAQAGAEAAQEVFSAIEARLSSIGFDPEARVYTPHMTLGRVRELERQRGKDLRSWLAEVPAALGTQRVTHATLLRSHLSPAGPRYERVLEVPLS
jgi:2'-5' RNA ligase